MTTFLEGFTRNTLTGAGINSATVTVKKHSDDSTVDSTTTAGSGADAGNYEFTEAEIGYPGQFYTEEVSGSTTRVRSSKVNGQLGPIRLNDLTRLVRALGSGVVADIEDEFACTAAGSDMIVDVAAGFAIGAGQTYYNAAADEVTISTADETNPRIDNIVIRFYPIDAADEDDVGKVEVVAVAGTPASSPVAPTPTQSLTTFWEEVLCTVEVAADATTIATANLNDARTMVRVANAAENETFDGTVTVTGAATLSSTLAVTGAATLSSTLAVTGATTLDGNVTLGNAASDDVTITGHLVGPATGPSIAAEAAAGSGATVAITGNDNWGTLDLTTGTGGTTGEVLTVTFGSAKPDTNYSVFIFPREADAAAAAGRIYAHSEATTHWDLTIITTALADSTLHQWNYLVLEF